MRHKIRVGNQHFWCILVTLENHNRFPRLYEKRFIFLEILQRLENCIERLPRARGFPTPAIDNKILRSFSNLRIKIILDHAIRGFAEPALAGEISSPRGMDDTGCRHM